MNKKEFIFIIFTHQLILYSEVIAEDGCSIRVMVLQIQKFMLVAMINLIYIFLLIPENVKSYYGKREHANSRVSHLFSKPRLTI